MLNRNWYFIFIFSIFWGVYKMYVYVCEWWHMITSGGGQRAISVLLRYGLFCWVLLLTPGKLVTSLGRRGMGEDGERCVSCLCFPSGCRSTGIKDVLLHLASHRCFWAHGLFCNLSAILLNAIQPKIWLSPSAEAAFGPMGENRDALCESRVPGSHFTYLSIHTTL